MMANRYRVQIEKVSINRGYFIETVIFLWYYMFNFYYCLEYKNKFLKSLLGTFFGF